MSSSAAQMLAAAHAATSIAPVSSSEDPSVPEEVVSSPAPTPAPGLDDDEAFPALGSSTVPSTVPSWGPKMSTSAFSAPSSASSSTSTFSTTNSVKSVRMQSKAVQEAFTIKFEDQLNLSKQEFASILNNLKKTYNCTIESTSSEKTKKRTFLITGELKEINKIRREIVRKITKPIKLEFFVPENSRAMVIGSGGKNLKPIIEETGVKINISHDIISSESTGEGNDDELLENSVKVTIDGDFENATIAKQRIIQIVNEHTKTLITKLAIPAQISPFVVQAINFPIPTDIDISLNEKTNDLCISGPREDVITVRNKVKQLLLADDKLPSKIVSKSFNVPKRLHRFIDARAIKDKYNVVIHIPEADEVTSVEFVGEFSNIEQALKFAKAESDKFMVDSLNIAKAHGKNLQHAKNLAIMYKYNDVLNDISKDSTVQIHTPSYKQILNANSTVNIDFAYSKENEAEFKTIKKKVIDLTNKYNPSFLRLFSDIDPLFVEKAIEASKDLAVSLNVQAIPFYKFDPKNNGILLFASDDEDDDFGPTSEELETKFENISEQWNSLRKLVDSLETKTFSDPEITEKIQDKISQGNFVQSLIDSCQSPLAIDLKVPSIDSITVRGTASDVAHAISEIEQFVEEAKNYEVASKYSTTLEFPSNQLSKLIGKNGEFVDSLRDKYDVKIDTNNGAPASDEKTTVKIIGLKRNAEAAKVEIMDLGNKWADETTLTLKVPSQYARRLIGSSGSYVNRLKTKYNVYIKTSRELDTQNNESFIIRGPSKGAKKAHEELKELLQYEIDNGHKVTFEVPRTSISRIIGKGGANLTALRDEHGVDINIEDKEDDSNKSCITIVGSKANIVKVEKEIKSVADEVANTITMEIDVKPVHYSAIIGPNGSNLRTILAKAKVPEDANTRLLLVIPDRGSDSTIISSTGSKKVVESIIKQVKDIVSNAEKMVTEKVAVPQPKHRLLIGTMGSIRRSIEEKFNITLNIPRLKADGTEPENFVTVKGLPENIADAKKYILEIISDKWADVVKIPVEYHGVLAGNNGQIFRKLRNELNVKIEHGENVRQAKKLVNDSNVSASSSSIKETEIPSGEKFVFIAEKDPKAVADSSLSGNIIEWRLIGDAKAASAAKKIIEDSLAAIRNYDTIGFIKVADRSSFRKVSGSKGSAVNKISKESKCSVFIPRDIDDTNDVIVVRGPSEGVEKAKEAIVKLL